MRNRTRGILLGVFMASVVTGVMFALVRADHDKHGREPHPYCESVVRRMERCNGDFADDHGLIDLDPDGSPEDQCAKLGDDDDFEPLARCAAKPSCLDFAACVLPQLDKVEGD